MLDKYPDKVKLVVKHFPLRNHKFARKAAEAALAADAQGKFWDIHHKLFQNYKAINDAKIQKIAEELNLDMKKFNSDMKSPNIRNLINRDMREGRQVGIRGTPTVFINGKRLKNRRLPDFTQMIEAELKKEK